MGKSEENIGKTIRLLLQNQDKSVKDLARAFGVTSAHIYSLLDGRVKMTPVYLSQFADFFGVTTDQLLGRQPIDLGRNVIIGSKEALEETKDEIPDDDQLRQIVEQAVVKEFARGTMSDTVVKTVVQYLKDHPEELKRVIKEVQEKKGDLQQDQR